MIATYETIAGILIVEVHDENGRQAILTVTDRGVAVAGTEAQRLGLEGFNARLIWEDALGVYSLNLGGRAHLLPRGTVRRLREELAA